MAQKTCENCNTIFDCLPENIENCQCFSISIPEERRKVIADFFNVCLCPECLEYFSTPLGPLKEVKDYYLNENGLMTFTKSYHLKRGYCCKSDCRHCPYE